MRPPFHLGRFFALFNPCPAEKLPLRQTLRRAAARFRPRKMISPNAGMAVVLTIFVQFSKWCELAQIRAKTTLACNSCALRLLFVFIPFTGKLEISNFQKVILQIKLHRSLQRYRLQFMEDMKLFFTRTVVRLIHLAPKASRRTAHQYLTNLVVFSVKIRFEAKPEAVRRTLMPPSGG
ncbi:hypothetical protein O8B39_03095 [Agrobacterium rhizogenes]|nr:hypothetical protein [Rhizobium rhizogenes]